MRFPIIADENFIVLCERTITIYPIETEQAILYSLLIN